MAIVNGYATRTQLASKMGLDSAKTALHADLLDDSITNASRFIDLKTNTFFFQQTFTDEIVDVQSRSDNGFYITRDCEEIVAPALIITIASLSESDTALTEKTTFSGSGDYIVKKGAGAILKNDGQWSTSPLAVTLTGDFGYSITPAEVKELCLTIASVYTRLDNRVVTDAEGDM